MFKYIEYILISLAIVCMTTMIFSSYCVIPIPIAYREPHHVNLQKWYPEAYNTCRAFCGPAYKGYLHPRNEFTLYCLCRLRFDGEIFDYAILSKEGTLYR